MGLLALALPALALAVIAAALLAGRAHLAAPAMFLLMTGSAIVAFLGAAEGEALTAAAGGGGTLVAIAGLVTGILVTDARLAAAAPRPLSIGAEPVAGLPRAGETLYSLTRKGRGALLVFIRQDADGRLLEATAYDPDHYV